MARTVNRSAIETELETIDTQISKLKAIGPLEGARIKWVKPGGTAGSPSREKKYPRLIYTDARSEAVNPQEVDQLKGKITAARELKRLIKLRDRLAARLQSD
jgi:hypothetical protein